MASKVRSINDIVAAAAGRPVVLCAGVFDLLHVGVVRHLERAKKLGGVLVVAVTGDEHAAAATYHAAFAEASRAEAVAAVGCVDFVTVCDAPTAAGLIARLRPAVYAPWDEPADPAGRAAEAEAVAALGGRIVHPDGAARAGGARAARAALSAEAQAYVRGFAAARPAADVLAHLDRLRGLRVLVVGEAIIDEYQYCESLGKSGKEPILAVRYLSEERFAGGVVAIANQVAEFCDRVGVVSLVGGRDPHPGFLRDRLRPNVVPTFVPVPGAPTVLKRRIVERYPFQKLFEIYVMEPDVPDDVSAVLAARLGEIVPEYDAVVVADYGHGMMTPEVVDLVCARAKFLAVNTQTNAANQGFNTVSKYPRADFVCVSEKELRLEARNRRKPLAELVAGVADRMGCGRVLITRGQSGCVCYEGGADPVTIPAFAVRTVDRVGAGDAVLGVAAPLAAAGVPADVAGFLGNAVGAQAVEVVGNREVVSRAALVRQVEALLH